MRVFLGIHLHKVGNQNTMTSQSMINSQKWLMNKVRRICQKLRLIMHIQILFYKKIHPTDLKL